MAGEHDNLKVFVKKVALKARANAKEGGCFRGVHLEKPSVPYKILRRMHYHSTMKLRPLMTSTLIGRRIKFPSST